MTDESRSPANPGVTRRGALALGGATLLAGCGLPGDLLGSESDAVEVDGATVAEIAAAEGPAVPGPFPVAVSDEYVSEARERVESSLAAVPLPLSAEDLPNGAMRAEINQNAEHARESLDSAEDASGPRERLELLARARGPARAVEAAWAYTEGELTAADVRSSRRSVREGIGRLRADHEYVGEDTVRAVVVHAIVESWTGTASNHAERGPETDGPVVNAVVVGERAMSVAEASASLANARHVAERFTESLSDPRSLRGTFVDARETLASTVESRMDDVPGRDTEVDELIDAEIEETVAGDALRDLHRGLPFDGVRTSTGRLAESVLDHVDALARVDAFASLRDTVEAGDHRAVESADDVRAIRSAAVTAVEDAVDASADERLARTVLAELAGWFEYVERDLERYADDDAVEVDWISREVSSYVVIEHVARATPDAVDEALAALDAE